MRLTQVLAAIALSALPSLAQGAIDDAFYDRFGGRVEARGASANDVLTWDGAKWVAAAPSGGGSGDLTEVQSTGTGITVTNGTGPIPSLALAELLQDVAAITTGTAGVPLGFGGQTALVPLVDLNLSTAGSIVWGASSNDVRIDKGGTKTIAFRVGDDTADAITTALSTALYNGASSFDNSTRGNTLGGNTALLLVDPDSGSNIRSYGFTSTAADGPTYVTTRGRGTHSSPTAVQSGDYLAGWIAQGYYSTAVDNEAAFAAIEFFADGGVAGGDAPGRIGFYTCADGSGSLTERWRISNAGHFLAGTDNTSDIGASGATRPRRVYVATEVVTPTLTLTNALAATGGGTGQTTCTQGDILYASASNTWSKLAAGTSGQFLKTQGAGANPTWATPASGVYMTLLPDRSVAPVNTTSFAALSSRNGHGIVAYDQSVNLEKRIWETTMPPGYTGGTLTVKVYWCAAGTTFGAAVWNLRIERIDTSLNIDSDSFASAQTATTTTASTSGATVVTTITLTQSQADSIAAGEPMRVELARDGASASDTLLVDAQVLRVTVQE